MSNKRNIFCGDSFLEMVVEMLSHRSREQIEQDAKDYPDDVKIIRNLEL